MWYIYKNGHIIECHVGWTKVLKEKVSDQNEINFETKEKLPLSVKAKAQKFKRMNELRDSSNLNYKLLRTEWQNIVIEEVKQLQLSLNFLKIENSEDNRTQLQLKELGK